MLNLNLCVILLSVTQVSSVLLVRSPLMDANGTFIIYDVTADHSSVGNLKTVFSNLRNVEYAVKIIGEDRAIFVVPDADDCDSQQTQFQGLKVEALPAVANATSVTLNESGIVVMVIESSRDDVSQTLAAALDNCGDCFKTFDIIGSKPQKIILIGNIPLDQVQDIALNTTSDACCDSVTTKRATDFNTHHKTCVDIHATYVAPVHKPIPLPHKPVSTPVHKPIPGHAFPDNVQHGADDHIPIGPHLPIGPHRNPIFPGHDIKQRIVDPHFRNIHFPGERSHNQYRPRNFVPRDFEFDPSAEHGNYV